MDCAGSYFTTDPLYHHAVVYLPGERQLDTLTYAIDANKLYDPDSEESQWMGIPVPLWFANNEHINHVLYVSDVDGVMRTSADHSLDSDVVNLAQQLLKTENVLGVFISGTPVVSDLSVEECRRDNAPLKPTFEKHFAEDIKAERIKVMGAMGAQQLTASGQMEIVESYALEQSFQLGKLLLEAFLSSIIDQGKPLESKVANGLLNQLNNIKLTNLAQDVCRTPNEFVPLLERIREELDPEVRLLCRGADVELQVSRYMWGEGTLITESLQGLLNVKVQDKENPLSSLEIGQRTVASGPAKHGVVDFNFIKISKLNKGQAVAKLVSDYVTRNPDVFVVCFGDSSVDLPMMRYSDLGIYVGGKNSILDLQHPPQMMVVTDKSGKDATHVEGTVRMMHALLSAIGQPFNQLKYIPLPNPQGNINYVSIADILQMSGCSSLGEVSEQHLIDKYRWRWMEWVEVDE